MKNFRHYKVFDKNTRMYDVVHPVRGEVCVHKISVTLVSFLLKCLCQARKVRGHAFVCSGIDFPSFTILTFDFGIVPTVWYLLFSFYCTFYPDCDSAFNTFSRLFA